MHRESTTGLVCTAPVTECCGLCIKLLTSLRVVHNVPTKNNPTHNSTITQRKAELRRSQSLLLFKKKVSRKFAAGIKRRKCNNLHDPMAVASALHCNLTLPRTRIVTVQ